MQQDEVDATDSPSPALEIEGRVEGEPDNRQTESGNAFEAAKTNRPGWNGGDTGSDIIFTEDIPAIIERGDMEQLAALVLNGEGTQLVGMESKQPEIQAFLDNVPAYMVSKVGADYAWQRTAAVVVKRVTSSKDGR